jgi:hypothetical protein
MIKTLIKKNTKTTKLIINFEIINLMVKYVQLLNEKRKKIFKTISRNKVNTE